MTRITASPREFGLQEQAQGAIQGPMPIRPSSESRSDRSLDVRLAEISAQEMVEQLGLGRLPSGLRHGLVHALSWASSRLGAALARFDEQIGTEGISQAAASTLRRLGATWEAAGPLPPRTGPVLVVANHPGAYDALVLLAAMERNDVGILAANRSFLTAMPELRSHLLLLREEAGPSGQIVGLRRAFSHLAAGHLVLHFPAGRIEPDPDFASRSTLLHDWRPGTATLARAAIQAGGTVVGALVSGVHSPRAKRHWVTRLVERRGVTTVAPLMQIVSKRCHDVTARIRFTDAIAEDSFRWCADQEGTNRLRAQVLGAASMRD